MMEGWRTCPDCGEDFPASCFTYSSGSRYWRVCSACWRERYALVRGPCEVCGKKMQTNRKPENADRPLIHKKCAA